MSCVKTNIKDLTKDTDYVCPCSLWEKFADYIDYEGWKIFFYITKLLKRILLTKSYNTNIIQQKLWKVAAVWISVNNLFMNF